MCTCRVKPQKHSLFVGMPSQSLNYLENMDVNINFNLSVNTILVVGIEQD